MNEYQLPKCLQVIGLACIPVNDIPDEHPALARRPVAAAVLTMVDQDDGHRWINTICVSDARKSEIPLPHLLDKTLLPGVVQISDSAILVRSWSASAFPFRTTASTSSSASTFWNTWSTTGS